MICQAVVPHESELDWRITAFHSFEEWERANEKQIDIQYLTTLSGHAGDLRVYSIAHPNRKPAGLMIVSEDEE